MTVKKVAISSNFSEVRVFKNLTFMSTFRERSSVVCNYFDRSAKKVAISSNFIAKVGQDNCRTDIMAADGCHLVGKKLDICVNF